MIATPAGGWYAGAIEEGSDPRMMIILASSPGHPLQPGDRIEAPVLDEVAA